MLNVIKLCLAACLRPKSCLAACGPTAVDGLRWRPSRSVQHDSSPHEEDRLVRRPRGGTGPAAQARDDQRHGQRLQDVFEVKQSLVTIGSRCVPASPSSRYMCAEAILTMRSFLVRFVRADSRSMPSAKVLAERAQQ